ncbi:LysE family translocator [Vibrio lamellibrachiae]|uniref:LysE family translocator n=1 Tax=Vibrio lamellibrachiae TaxID=2910253 RepID=UPI003D117F54
MDYIQIVGFSFVALLLVVSPGPNGLLIAKTVPTSGKQAGFSNVVGFLTAFYLHGALSILGISALLTKSSEAFFIVKVLGACYLSWIGIKSLMGALSRSNISSELEQKGREVSNRDSGQRENKHTGKGLKKSFFEGFLTNALNPKVSMFYLAAFPQFIPTGEYAIAYAFLLVTIHSAINLLWFSSVIMLLSRITVVSKSESIQRILKGITGTVFIAFGVKLLALEQK